MWHVRAVATTKEPATIHVVIDDDVRRDLERAHALTGITSRADLVRHAIKMLVKMHDDGSRARSAR